MKMDELCQLWLKSKKGTIKKTSLNQYERIIRSYISGVVGDIDLNDMNIEVIIDMCNTLSNDLSHKSLQDIIVVLKCIIRYGNMLGYTHIMIDAFPTYKNKRKKVEVISDEDLVILEKYLLENPTNKNIGLLICLYTGMRLGEICALRWEDIILNDNKIIVRHNIIRIYEEDK